MSGQARFLWMSEVLEHLHRCCDEVSTAGGATELYLSRSIERSMGEFRRLCQSARCEALANGNA